MIWSVDHISKLLLVQFMQWLFILSQAGLGDISFDSGLMMEQAPCSCRLRCSGDIATIQMHLDDARNSMSLVNKKGVGPIHDVQMLKRLGFGTNHKDVTTPLHYAVAFGVLHACFT